MRYMGGKSRIANHIIPIIASMYKSGMIYVEPFVGGANIVSQVKFASKRIAGDIDPQLICMWKSVSEGWIPPKELSEVEYQQIKDEQPSGPITAFAKYGCSFGGKAWGGYARPYLRKGRGKSDHYEDHVAHSHNSIMRKAAALKSVEWYCGQFVEAPVTENCLVYCDPPYAGTTDYKTNFDHDAFWETVREWSKRNIVVVSEYAAPSDFKSIWTFSRPMQMRGVDGTSRQATENLFVSRHTVSKQVAPVVPEEKPGQLPLFADEW